MSSKTTASSARDVLKSTGLYIGLAASIVAAQTIARAGFDSVEDRFFPLKKGEKRHYLADLAVGALRANLCYYAPALIAYDMSRHHFTHEKQD